MTKEQLENIEFHTPPACQGQAVTYSYGIDPDAEGPACIIRRRTEYGEPAQYERFEDPEWAEEHSSNLDFWDREPELGELVEEWTEGGDIADAVELIRASPAADGDGYIYRADEVGLWYRITAEELQELADLIAAGLDDAYSHWCNSSGEEIGDDDTARDLGLIS
jgi:hypothetical protein